jgi:hypothetical protein
MGVVLGWTIQGRFLHIVHHKCIVVHSLTLVLALGFSQQRPALAAGILCLGVCGVPGGWGSKADDAHGGLSSAVWPLQVWQARNPHRQEELLNSCHATV